MNTVEREVVTVEASDELSNDIRHSASKKFVSDNDFVKTPEFKAFLYEYKGKQTRENIKHATPESETEAFKELQTDTDKDMETITFQRGRELLEEVGVMLVSGWDMTYAIVFDDF